MCTHFMPLYMSILTKRLTAHVTLEWFLTQMYPLMSFSLRQSHKNLVTITAFIEFLSCMDSFMSLHTSLH